MLHPEPLSHCLAAAPAAALGNYLGDDREQWRQYDATLLAESYSGPSTLPILMDTGEGCWVLWKAALPRLTSVGCNS
jgi:hypothetical protein